MPPPSLAAPPVAEFPEIVLSLSVRLPVVLLLMPAPRLSPLPLTVFPEIVLPVIVSVPLF